MPAAGVALAEIAMRRQCGRRAGGLGRHRQPGGAGGRGLRARPGAGAFFLDFNSASPGAKIRAARIVNAAGGAMSKAP
jgi:hypothetical protein